MYNCPTLAGHWCLSQRPRYSLSAHRSASMPRISRCCSAGGMLGSDTPKRSSDAPGTTSLIYSDPPHPETPFSREAQQGFAPDILRSSPSPLAKVPSLEPSQMASQTTGMVPSAHEILAPEIGLTAESARPNQPDPSLYQSSGGVDVSTERFLIGAAPESEQNAGALRPVGSTSQIVWQDEEPTPESEFPSIIDNKTPAGAALITEQIAGRDSSVSPALPITLIASSNPQDFSNTSTPALSLPSLPPSSKALNFAPHSTTPSITQVDQQQLDSPLSALIVMDSTMASPREAQNSASGPGVSSQMQDKAPAGHSPIPAVVSPYMPVSKSALSPYHPPKPGSPEHTMTAMRSNEQQIAWTPITQISDLVVVSDLRDSHSPSLAFLQTSAPPLSMAI